VDGVQGGSVVKVEEEEETSLYGNDGWLRVAARVCVVLVEKDTTEKSKGSEREKD